MWGVDGSGNSHKVRMFLTMLGLPWRQQVPGSLRPASQDLLDVNPAGCVPVLVDPNAGVTITDSHAIIVYLALAYGADKAASWFPTDPVRAAAVAKWMSFSANEVHGSLTKVRVAELFDWAIPFPLATAYSLSRQVLGYLDSELAKSGHEWLAPGAAPTLADICVFPYVALAEASSKGQMSLAEYPAVAAWVARVKALPGFITMDGL